MIVGVGLDIADVGRIQDRLDQDALFSEEIYTTREIEYCRDKRFSAEHLAVRFAAKEAFLKALGMGINSGISLVDIEVVNLSNGKPALKLHGEAKVCLEEFREARIHLSITHTRQLGAAVVLIEAKGDM